MSDVHPVRDERDRLVRAKKREPNKAKGQLRERSLCNENQALYHKGRWTWDPDNGKTVLTTPKKQILFSQGDAADAAFYIQAGKVKLSVVSQQGKEAVVAILKRGAFLGRPASPDRRCVRRPRLPWKTARSCASEKTP